MPISPARAQLEQGRVLIVADAPESPGKPGRAVFTNIPPGRYVLRTLAIAYRGQVDTVSIRPGAVDTIRTYLDVVRCDLDCPDIQPRRRPWWKFWTIARRTG